MLGDPGEIVRAQLRKEKQLKLKVRTRIGKAFDTSETNKLSTEVAKSRSPHIYMAFTLARNAGLRDTEIKTLTWGQINLTARFLTVGRAKTEAGEGRTIPFNDELYEAFVQHQAEYEKKFGQSSRSGTCSHLVGRVRPIRPGMSRHSRQPGTLLAETRKSPAGGTITDTR